MMNDEIACPFCAEPIKAAAVVCRHCKTDLRRPARSAAPVVRKSGFPVWIIVVVVCVAMVPILAIVAAIAIPGLLNAQRASNERNAFTSLKTIGTAQAMFRAEDKDNNQTRDFWTGDVAGLYAIDNSSTGAAVPAPIKLIEVSIALADQDATSGTLTNRNYSKPINNFGVRSSKSGYWYRGLIEDREAGKRYREDTDQTGDLVHSVSRFGVCAMPESYGTGGRKVFILNENNSTYSRDFGGDVLHVGDIPPHLLDRFDTNWPSRADLDSHWSKMD